LATVSAGPTGCSPSEITILDQSNDGFTEQDSGIAVCRGRRHQCSRFSASVTCTAQGDSAGGEAANVVAPAATEPAAASEERRVAVATALAGGNRSILACFPEQPTVEMTLLVSAQGAVYDFRAPIPLGQAERDCLEHAFMWLRAPRESTPAAVQLRFPIDASALRVPQPPTPVAPVVGASATTDPTPTPAPALADDATRLRIWLDAQREAILACTERTTVVVTARWDASGAVSVALVADLAGTPAEGCVRSAVGWQRVTPSPAGELRHLVR